MLDIIAIGSTTQDTFLEVDCPLIDWPETPLKKALVLPFGEKLEVRQALTTIGGNAANASITFSRQGFKTACFGKIGDDTTSDFIIRRLKKEKVKPLFTIGRGQDTARSTLLLKNGERTILGYHGAANTLVTEDIKWNTLKSRAWYLSLSGESDALLRPLLEFAKSNDIFVGFNPSGHHIHHRRQEVIDLLPLVSFLVMNEGEAAELTGIHFEREKEVFAELDRMMPGIVAITNGEKGATVSDGKIIYKAGVFPEKQLADRTGAGDAFGSGFVSGLMRHAPKKGPWTFAPDVIEYALRLATANATATIEHIGGTEGVLTRKEFESADRFRTLAIDRITS